LNKFANVTPVDSDTVTVGIDEGLAMAASMAMPPSETSYLGDDRCVFQRLHPVLARNFLTVDPKESSRRGPQ
jgi:hypothetical protein